MKAQRTWQALTVSVLLVILGLGMLGFWAMWLAQGNLRGGIATIENNQFIVFHLTAETIAALLALVGATGLGLGWAWGRTVSFVAGGMVVYATINSLAHSVKNDPALTPIFVVSLAVVLFCFALLGSERMTARGQGESVPSPL
jgi:hypothetical protein